MFKGGTYFLYNVCDFDIFKELSFNIRVIINNSPILRNSFKYTIKISPVLGNKAYILYLR